MSLYDKGYEKILYFVIHICNPIPKCHPILKKEYFLKETMKCNDYLKYLEIFHRFITGVGPTATNTAATNTGNTNNNNNNNNNHTPTNTTSTNAAADRATM